MEVSEENLRKSKEEVKSQFEKYKKEGKLDLFSLQNFITHCNVIPEIIETYLIILQKEDKNSFIDQLLFYYPILSVDTCKNFGVEKKITEKERFFKFIESLSSIKINSIEENLKNLLNKEIFNYDEIVKLVPQEIIESDKEKESDQNKYSRWFNTYNTSIDYKSEDNEEYLFYHLSNSLISEFLKEPKCFKRRKTFINSIINLFEVAYEKKKKEKKFNKHFEFLCLALTNCENEKENSFGNLVPFIESIENEIDNTYMNLDEIKHFLTKKNYDYEIKDKMIIINYQYKKFIIDDYNKYNINEEVLNSIIGTKRFRFQEILEKCIKFTELIKNTNYTNGLFLKIIKKYSKSNIIHSSIQKLFKIEEEEYRELFQILSNQIEKYIYIFPYNCYYDTERTTKNPMKILIDPYKEKYHININLLGNNINLYSTLKEFCNIAFRKFAFGHETHHLTTALLYFLYINEDSKLNLLTKEITSEGEVNILPFFDPKELKKNSNIQNEAGNLFELLCYGKIQKSFTLKQLLFIVDENNDNLDYKSFKENYINFTKKNLIEILENFPNDQLLSEHVKKIEENLKKKDPIQIESLGNKIIVQKDYADDSQDAYTFLNNDDSTLVSELDRYDNHLFMEKRPNMKK